MSDTALLALGRVLLATIFIISGFGKLTDIGGTAGYLGSLGLPLPIVTAWIVALIEFVGGIAVLVGFQTRVAAFVLGLFTIGTALIGHFDFGDQGQVTQFMKNLAIAGGFFVLTAHGAGALSIDARR
ncbi:DoxX family protein [Chelativorans sp. YIM 93263]|uniref:DoxX family protein n=1 Tax=Chelativorans sp. YIM 93263 TaxID=2906648 RepID=UPI00237966A0|nr:DoxX family protein [Chelativorans sp. YIM 93263]